MNVGTALGKESGYGSNGPSVVNATLVAWQMRGMLVHRTKFPLKVTTPGDVANVGDITKVLNRIKDQRRNLPL